MDQQIDIEKIWRGWKIVELIGTGSYGKVYKIMKEDFGHTYVSALKVMAIPTNQAEIVSVRNEGMDEKSVTSYFYSMVEDIVKECALMSKLQGNSNIVSYEDHAVVPHQDGIGWDIYIRMEYLTPLYERLNKSPLKQQDVVKLGIDICRALETCGTYDIIHRDIKPENIFLSDLGHFKLGDFGIARQLERTSAGLTKTGTLTYMAPEIYLGREYNASVDLYSLGIVLYRFLNDARAPFLPPAPQPITVTERERATQRRFSGEPIPPPSIKDDALVKVVLKACAFDPKQRYHDAAEMRKDLEAVLSAYSAPKAVSEDVKEKEQKTVEKPKEEPEKRHEGTKKLPREKQPNPDGTVVLLLPEQADHASEPIQSVEEEKGAEKGALPEEQQEVPEQQEEGSKDSITEEGGRFKNRKVLAVFGCTAVVLLGFGFILFSMNQKQEQQQKSLMVHMTAAEQIAVQYKPPKITEVKTPNLVGLTKENAEEALKKAGLTPKEGKGKYSDKVQAGIVMSQKPKKNMMVPEGTEIKYVISLGVKQRKIPLVKGLSLEEAQRSLEEARLKVSSEEVFDEDVDAGIVISQSLEAGGMAEPDTEVHLVVSKGPKPQEEEKPSSRPSKQETYVPEVPVQPEPSVPEVPAQEPEPPAQEPEAPPESDFNWME